MLTIQNRSFSNGLNDNDAADVYSTILICYMLFRVNLATYHFLQRGYQPMEKSMPNYVDNMAIISYGAAPYFSS